MLQDPSYSPSISGNDKRTDHLVLQLCSTPGVCTMYDLESNICLVSLLIARLLSAWLSHHTVPPHTGIETGTCKTLVHWKRLHAAYPEKCCHTGSYTTDTHVQDRSIFPAPIFNCALLTPWSLAQPVLVVAAWMLCQNWTPEHCLCFHAQQGVESALDESGKWLGRWCKFRL
jgi:hypothetical protein